MRDSQLLRLELKINKPTRLDLALLEALDAPCSRAQLKRFIETGAVSVSGKRAQAKLALEPGTYEVTLQDWEQFQTQLTRLEPAATCFLPVLYEDENLLVLDKASGTPSVSLSGSDTTSAAAAALAHSPKLAEIEGAKPLEPGLLHRLDTATSGVLAFAKTSEEFERVKEAWKTPKVVKTYRAIVQIEPGTIPPEVCTLSSPIARPADSAKRMIVVSTEHARMPEIRGNPLPAITHIRRVTPLGENRFDLEIEIETGVMHQIRAHLANEGWPIVGDRVYRGIQASRLMLHAWKLRLPLKSGRTLEIESKFEL